MPLSLPGYSLIISLPNTMLLFTLAIVAGFVVLTLSADRFVLGASALAKNLGVPPLLVGLVIVGFGTSAPEIIVSGIASWQGNGNLAVGNALGSNITNIGLVLGVTALVTPLLVQSSIVKKELPLLFVVMGGVLLLLLDQSLHPMDGWLLTGGTVLMVTWVVWQGLKTHAKKDSLEQEFADEMPENMSTLAASGWLLFGLLLLVGSSKILVWGAVGIATAFGVSDLIIGLTIIAIGTSLPELAASVMSALRNEHDIAVGNIIGSNMYNLLAVLALPGLFGPVSISSDVLTRDFPLMVGLSIALWIMAIGLRGKGAIQRIEGALLVMVFIAYQIYLYMSL